MARITDVEELNKSLEYTPGIDRLQRVDDTRVTTLTGQARVSLADRDRLRAYVRKEFVCDSLDKMAGYFRAQQLAGTPSYYSIAPLHYQGLRNRNIIPNESPLLHLVWYYDRIFVKPLPPYLLSSAFWSYLEAHKDTEPQVWRGINGFVRTYWYLIQYELDFKRAQDPAVGLIPLTDGGPNGGEPVTYERFVRFIERFENLAEDDVSPRYLYGELRLSRLNWMARIFLRKLTYHHVHSQWYDYFSGILAPFITVFVILTTVLSAMQVELQVEGMPEPTNGFQAFAMASRWFSVVVITCVAIVVVILAMVALIMAVHDQSFARQVWRERKRNGQAYMTERKPGVV